MLQRALSLCREAIFPIFCVNCGSEGVWWCNICRLPTTPIIVATDTPLDGCVSLFSYQIPAIKKLVQEFKYHYVENIITLWEECLWQSTIPFEKGLAIIPVPLFQKRLRERGYNQAELFAGIVSKIYNLPINKNLKRIRATAQQAKLNKSEREQNVADAFVWQVLSPVPEEIILVDDVYTTGATMRACALELKRCGAKHVRGLVLAHD